VHLSCLIPLPLSIKTSIFLKTYLNTPNPIGT
jgi:ABC-type phosphate transport system permease subunit